MSDITLQITITMDNIITASRKLISLLENEKLLLAENKFDKLEENAVKKRLNVDELDTECTNLKELFKKLALTFNQDGLHQLITKAPINLKDEIAGKSKLMLDFLKQTETLNRVNGVLLVSKHNYNQQLLGLMTQKQLKPVTYGKYVGSQSVSTRGHKA